MKKTFIYLIGILATVSLFTSCEKNDKVNGKLEYCAEATVQVVNEQGEPIPNVELWYFQNLIKDNFDEIPFSDYESYREIYTNGTGLRTDENGKLVFLPYYPQYPHSVQTAYIISCFFDTDGEENGSYEPLFITDPIRLDFIWNGKDFDGTTNIMFEPIDLGTFVMHEK